MKKVLTQPDLITSAKAFCTQKHQYRQLFGVTDGKAVGTFLEHQFQDQIAARFDVSIGNSASGLDLPSIETDIKVTSIRQPQSSCRFRSARQKIFGLGYHLLLFVYDKRDDSRHKNAVLSFVSCAFIDKSRTADHQTTRSVLEILERDGNRDDVFAYLKDRNLPGDDDDIYMLVDELMQSPPILGYLTISNALQWRLQYGRVVGLTEPVSGIIRIV